MPTNSVPADRRFAKREIVGDGPMFVGEQWEAEGLHAGVRSSQTCSPFSTSAA